MDATEFAESLRRIAPSKSRLAAAGYPEDEAERSVAEYSCVRRQRPLRLETRGDDLLRLVRDWDVSSIEIGMFSFRTPPIVEGRRVEIGVLEVDPVSHRTVEMDYIMEEYVTGRFICRVAPSGGALLDALLDIAAYFAKTSVGDIDPDDDARALAVKEKCVDLLGGDDYVTFCTMLLGV